ncbi:hypothetical protein M5K25_004658 [Dendrobium thyrsiflorum]|uniref:HTH myb-type domain-containing protein n=1 Tax=Dendrobium thyrsiflorum TaxID=117978 RepID=A0ABD0VFZ0_DENTH
MLYMAAFPSELSLDYNPTTYPMNLDQKSYGEQAEQMQKLQELLARLEDERLKIDAFKRELPLCMQLLNNAMEAYRRQLETYQTNQGPRLVLEEFIPLNKNLNIQESDKPSSSEKASWMVSAQLWSSEAGKQQTMPSTTPLKETIENSFILSSKQALEAKPRCGGAFHPFSKEKSKDLPPTSTSCSSTTRILPELALASADDEMEEKKSSENGNGERSGRREGCSKSGGSDQPHNKGGGGGGGGSSVPGDGSPTAQRKARRCWSPDLHRRFVNALQILGGSQVATPKQIRELMKVDGLTNDEVKSHLQKYRLHTRRPMPAPAAAPTAPQLLVLGGIWVPPEYASSAAAAAGPTLYGAHPVPAHYCPSSQVPQDYYQVTTPPALVAAAAAQFHSHLPPLHRVGGTNLYKGRQVSPESDHRSDGERSESIEEEQEGQGREEEEDEEEEENDKKVEEKELVVHGEAKLQDNGVLLNL